MRYSGLCALADLLSDVRRGGEIKPNHNTKVELAEVENFFKNLITDVDKAKAKSNKEIMFYRLRIEVKK